VLQKVANLSTILICKPIGEVTYRFTDLYIVHLDHRELTDLCGTRQS